MTIKIATLNCNGLRACVRNGFWEWFDSAALDLICFQEVRYAKADMDSKHSPPEGWFQVQSDAQKKGYSGVAIWSKKEPIRVCEEIGLPWADDEGRAVSMEFEEFKVWSIYFPSGTSGEARQTLKDQFLVFMTEKMASWKAEGKAILLCGDVNIAHTEMDLFHHKSNKKNSGFLSHEREWMSQQMDDGWVDMFRHLHPKEEAYSWWSNRSKTSRLKNVGWRIDYQLGTVQMSKFSTAARIDGPMPKISDHAPVVVEYSFS
jgi:exodeoxyribonuclease-3